MRYALLFAYVQEGYNIMLTSERIQQIEDWGALSITYDELPELLQVYCEKLATIKAKEASRILHLRAFAESKKTLCGKEFYEVGSSIVMTSWKRTAASEGCFCAECREVEARIK